MAHSGISSAVKFSDVGVDTRQAGGKLVRSHHFESARAVRHKQLLSFRKVAGLASGLLGLAASVLLSPSAAASCGSGATIELPIKLVANLPFVSLTIEKQAVTFILDTGAERTVVTPALVDRLHLRQDKTYARQLRSFGSAVAGREVELPGLAAAGIALRNFGAVLGSDLPSIGDTIPDGLLGADILSSFDVDLDLPHGRIRLYNDQFCATLILERSYTTITANRSLHNRLFFSATLDGRSIAAAFDTGAPRSVLDVRAARLALTGRPLDGGPAVALRGIAGSVQAHVHRFRELLVAGQRVADPALLVAPLGLQDADLLLGMDFLRSRRVWLSYRSHRLYLTTPYAVPR